MTDQLRAYVTFYTDDCIEHDEVLQHSQAVMLSAAADLIEAYRSSEGFKI